MSAKVYKCFQSTSNKCSPRHLECGFDIPAELFPIRVKNFFAQGTNKLNRSRKFFKPKIFLDTVSGKTVFAWKMFSLYKERVCAHNRFLFFETFKHFILGRFLRTIDGNKSPVCASCLRTITHTHTHTHINTHTHTHTHTHTSNKKTKKTTEKPGFYYIKVRKVSTMAFAKSPS